LEFALNRPAAEEALRKFGPAARDPLLLSAATPFPNRDEETPASTRRHRNAIGLLAEVGIALEDWEAEYKYHDDTRFLHPCIPMHHGLLTTLSPLWS